MLTIYYFNFLSGWLIHWNNLLVKFNCLLKVRNHFLALTNFLYCIFLLLSFLLLMVRIKEDDQALFIKFQSRKIAYICVPVPEFDGQVLIPLFNCYAKDASDSDM